MAKPYKEINKTEFRDNYNIGKILIDKQDIMEQLKTFNPNSQAVAFGYRKKPRVTLEDIMIEIKDIKIRLDNIVTKNNLIE